MGFWTRALGVRSAIISSQPETAPRAKLRYKLVRPALDALAAFAVFGIAALTLNCAPSSASPNTFVTPSLQKSAFQTVNPALAEAGVRPLVEIATTSSPNNPDAVYRRTSAQAAWSLLAIAFSLAVALNLAVFRHLRQAYAHPRRQSANR
jgi:hypothetical protein